jgi:thymidylate synthase (FAD)
MNHEVHTATFVNITPKAEEHMAYCARVSNPSNQNNHETAPRLLRYCIKHKHWSIFETASMQVEINTTRAIAAQVLRHRSFSFQEFSQRYSSAGDLPSIGLPHLRSQDLKNKQASHDDLDPEVVDLMNKQIQQIYHSTFDYYEYLLSKGVAKECARSILPLGTPTRMYQSGTIRSFIHYVEVRAGIETQLEHRLIAQDIKRIFIEQLPTVAEALEWTHDH